MSLIENKVNIFYTISTYSFFYRIFYLLNTVKLLYYMGSIELHTFKEYFSNIIFYYFYFIIKVLFFFLFF